MNGNTSNLGFDIALGTASEPVIGQTFRNIPIPNLNPCVYAMAIRSPYPPYDLVALYTFPLSPEHVQRESAAMSSIYDVAGSPAQNGVQRIVDQYGNSPLIFTLEGTTGFQFHGSDGFQFTGLQSIQYLQSFLNSYAQLNQQQMQAGIPSLYKLEWYDYFQNDFWEVVPIGPQGFRQNRNRPLLVSYLFRWAGIRNISAPLLPLADAVAVALSTSETQAAQNLTIGIAGLLTTYAAATLVTS